ncbi:uncharacterized mitochondrial protein-like protein [Tanacetum coccineum]
MRVKCALKLHLNVTEASFHAFYSTMWYVSQRKYAKDLLSKFGMQNCNGEATPMNLGEKLQQDDGTEFADPSYYRSLVGGLNYLTNTRPDIMFSVSVLFRHMHHMSQPGS